MEGGDTQGGLDVEEDRGSGGGFGALSIGRAYLGPRPRLDTSRLEFVRGCCVVHTLAPSRLTRQMRFVSFNVL